jgi:hypothetical protein
VIRARSRRTRTGVIDYQLRYRIRKFLRVREVAARAAGVEPQQYLVLLQLTGPEGPIGVRPGEAATLSVWRFLTARAHERRSPPRALAPSRQCRRRYRVHGIMVT